MPNSTHPQAQIHSRHGHTRAAAAEYVRAKSHNPNTKAALATLLADLGQLPGAQLTADHVQRAAAAWKAAHFAQHTRSTYSKCLRRFLRWLERIGTAPP